MHHVAFWLAVGLVSVASVVLFKTLFLRFHAGPLTTIAGAI